MREMFEEIRRYMTQESNPGEFGLLSCLLFNNHYIVAFQNGIPNIDEDFLDNATF